MFAALTTPFPGTPAALLSAVFFASSFILPGLVMLRSGLVAGMVAFYMLNATASTPLTLDPAQWYASQTVLTVGVLAALFAYAFWVALAGQPIFRESLFDNPN